MRFASHRDVVRAIERGVRRAGVPVAYSAGFSPHPRISYSGGAPTGSASEAEYLELSVTRRCEPADVGRRLNDALPDGIDVVEVVEADGRSAAVAPDASEWEVIWPGVARADAARAVAEFLAEPSVQVERLTSKGTRRLDARAAVVSLDVQAGPGRRAGTGASAGCAILRMIVRQMAPAVRPDDILTALSRSPALASGAPPVVTRLWQGSLSERDVVQTGMIVGAEAAQSGRIATLPVAPTPVPPHRPEDLGPAHDGPESWPGHDGPGRVTDKEASPETGSAAAAPAQARANQQLPRGTLGQPADQRAREPYGRDCPDARDRATERQTIRSQ